MTTAAYTAGCEARRSGGDLVVDNPYIFGSVEWQDWRNGWDDTLRCEIEALELEKDEVFAEMYEAEDRLIDLETNLNKVQARLRELRSRGRGVA